MSKSNQVRGQVIAKPSKDEFKQMCKGLNSEAQAALRDLFGMGGTKSSKVSKVSPTKSTVVSNISSDGMIIDANGESHEKCLDIKMNGNIRCTEEDKARAKQCNDDPSIKTKMKIVNILIEQELEKPWYLTKKSDWFRSEGKFSITHYMSVGEACRSVVSKHASRITVDDAFESFNEGKPNPFTCASLMELVPVPTRKYKDDVPVEKRIKGPFTPDWQKTTLDNYNDAFNYNEAGGIAVVTGKASNIFVIDIDKPKDGELDGLAWLRKCHESYLSGLNNSKDKDKFIKLCGGHFANTMVQQSGGGGYHFIYQHEPIFDLIKNGARDIIKGEGGKSYSIDIKNDNGAINFAPSVHVKTGKKYRLIEEFEGQKTTQYPNFMPPYLIHMLITSMQENGYRFCNIDSVMYGSMKDGVWRTPEMKAEEKVKKSLVVDNNEDQIESNIEKIVRNIDPKVIGSYSPWTKFIYALSYESRKSGDPNKYRDLCIEISKAAPGWDDNSLDQIKSLWKSELPDGVTPCTKGTLMRFLRMSVDGKTYHNLMEEMNITQGPKVEYNYEDTAEFFKNFNLLENGEQGRNAKMNELFGFLNNCIIPIVGDVSNGLYYMVKNVKIDEVYGVSNYIYERSKPKAIKSITDRIPIRNGYITKKGEIIDISLTHFIELASHGSHTYNRFSFYPCGPKSNTSVMLKLFKEHRILNTFRGFAFQYDPNFKVDHDMLTPVFTLIDALCGGNKAVNEYFIKWLAHIIQFPETKTGTCMMFKSDQGSGKSEFFDWFGHAIIGKTYYNSCPEISHLAGHFNSTLENKILVHLEEVNMYSINNSILNKLKDLITGKSNNIERKGVDVECGVMSHLNIAASTNKNLNGLFEPGDRRSVVSECKMLYPANDPRWSSYVSYYKDPRTGPNFAHYLMSIETSTTILKNIPETETKNRIINSGAPLFARFIYDEYCNIKFGEYSVFNVTDEEYYCTSAALFGRLRSYCEEHGEKPLTDKIMKQQSINIFGVESKSKWVDEHSGEYCTKANGGKQKQTYIYSIEVIKKKLGAMKFDMNPEAPDPDDLE